MAPEKIGKLSGKKFSEIITKKFASHDKGHNRPNT